MQVASTTTLISLPISVFIWACVMPLASGYKHLAIYPSGVTTVYSFEKTRRDVVSFLCHQIDNQDGYFKYYNMIDSAFHLL